MEEVDRLVAALRQAPWDAREPIKKDLQARAAGPAGAKVREHLENLKRGELLEVQWEIEEVLEAVTPKQAEPPKKEAPAPPPEAPPDPNRPLTAKDLVLAYDDPRGLLLHKTKAGPERWFATQADPRTGQPQTFELHAQEIAQLKGQLANSPYWVIGVQGAGPTVAAAKPPLGKPPGRP